jgi:4a-hydroxytetrahydrobiopterin dehydratase
MASLSTSEVDQRLGGHAGWTRNGDELTKQFSFGDFKQAMKFVNAVADAANAADHHPDMNISYNRVTMTLSTHSEGGITEKDFALATKIDDAAGT